MIVPKNGAELQAALNKSGQTGEPVQLDGIYTVNTDLLLNGATLRGNLRANLGNWNLSRAVIHVKGAHSVIVNNMGQPPVIEGVAVVFYHATTPNWPGLLFPSDSYGAVVRDVVIDRAGVGIKFMPGDPKRQLAHRFRDLRIQQFRSCGIDCTSPNASDIVFDGHLYLEGRNLPDYDNVVCEHNFRTGIYNFANTWDMQSVLIENCHVGLHTHRVINSTIGTLRVDHCLGVGIQTGAPWTDKLYSGALTIGHYYVGAAVPRCRTISGDRAGYQHSQIGRALRGLCTADASWAAPIWHASS